MTALHRPRGRFGWVLVLVVSAVAIPTIGSALLSGCGTDANVEPSDGGGDENAIDGAPTFDGAPLDAGADVTCLDASPDADIDCTGKCGPVVDTCTSKVKQCGGCQPVGGETRVCDLATNSCIKPKLTCADLAAECGTVKDSCGNYLDCPDTPTKGCAAGKECDPDTHKCRDCQNVTCQDLGIQCGFAFLGCGTDTQANLTDCGSCAADADGGLRKCNQAFHVCEPSCTPKTAAQLCADAKAKRGVECGVITNGCGGTVNCDSVAGFGCAAGESCGVRGIANRCDKKQAPDECKALGKNCGTITSACNGQVVSCGDCAAGEVCNANGVCGPPCAPKTCADFTAFECGIFDDTCGGTVTCGTCPGGVCDTITHSCCATNTCGATFAGQCGNDLPNGCGQNVLDCACASGSCTVDGGASPAQTSPTPGMCCVPKTPSSYTSVGQCGTNLPNGCGANNVNAPCGANQDCVNNATSSPGPAPGSGVVGSCCTRTDSCAVSFPTNTCGPLQDSCRPAGVTNQCNSCVGPKTCNSNVCCQVAPACAGNGNAGGECNVTKTPVDPGCGSDRPCTCKPGLACWCTNHACTGADGAGACKAALTCSSAGYSGKCGTALDNGIGGTINCGCGTGKVCSTSTPNTVGTCQCNNPTGSAYNCGNVPGGPGQPGGDPCGTFNDGCGSTITCTCPGGQFCNTTPNPNVCCAPMACASPPALGTACGTLTNGCNTVTCGCPTGAGNENFTCTGGACACIKDTCKGRTGHPPDRCGGLLDCGG